MWWGSPREVPTRQYPGSYHDTAENGTCLTRKAWVDNLIHRSITQSLWTVSQSVLTGVTQVCGPAPSRMSAVKPVVVLRRDILFAVAFYEDVLNKGSPFTERRACNKGRGVSTETCHSNVIGSWSTNSMRCVVWAQRRIRIRIRRERERERGGGGGMQAGWHKVMSLPLLQREACVVLVEVFSLCILLRLTVLCKVNSQKTDERQTEWQTVKQTDRQNERQNGRQTDRVTDRKNRQTERQTEKDRQADRQTDRDRDRQGKKKN